MKVVNNMRIGFKLYRSKNNELLDEGSIKVNLEDALENIPLEEQEKFRALCQFYKEKDPTFFANSIDREDAIEKNQKRLIQATNEFLSTTPLKELTGANIVRYFESVVL